MLNIECIPAGQLGANCYLVSDDDFAVIIDPGFAERRIKEFARLNVDKKYKYILLTHFHIDHVEGAHEIKDILCAPVVISFEDSHGLLDPMINLSETISANRFSMQADITVSEGRVLNIGEKQIRVMQVPGHTKGSVIYIIDNIMFSGDTLFRGGIGRYDLPCAAPEKYRETLKRISELPGDYVIYPGHGEQTTLQYERQNNMYLMSKYGNL